MANKFLSRDKSAASVNMKTYLWVSLILALLCGALRSLAYAVSFDADIGYFNGSLFSTAVTYLIILSCAFAISGFIFISKEAAFPRELDTKPNSVFFATALTGFVFLGDFAFKIYTMLTEHKLDEYSVIFSPGYPPEMAYIARATAIIEILGTVSSLLAAICFLLRASSKAKGKAVVWLGFFPILRALSAVAVIYFEMDIQMNHPSKLMLQFALISMMIWFLYELRFSVSEDHVRPRAFFLFGCVAFILTFTAGASEMYGYLSGNLKRGDFCVEAFFCLTVSIYILAKINSYVRQLSAE